MKEQAFKTIMNSLWAGFMKAGSILKALENIGIFVDDKREGAGLHELYSIQSKMSDAVVNMLGPLENRDGIQEKVDRFLSDCFDQEVESDAIPDDVYEDLIKILKSAGVSLPWENAHGHLGDSHDRYRRHRAVSIKNNTLIKGYLWAGADHVYIAPDYLGISFDEETGELSAYAEEVYRDTVAVDTLILDDNMVPLFNGDTVKIGDDVFVLDIMDINTLQKLCSSERKEKGLLRVKPVMKIS